MNFEQAPRAGPEGKMNSQENKKPSNLQKGLHKAPWILDDTATASTQRKQGIKPIRPAESPGCLNPAPSTHYYAHELRDVARSFMAGPILPYASGCG